MRREKCEVGTRAQLFAARTELLRVRIDYSGARAGPRKESDELFRAIWRTVTSCRRSTRPRTRRLLLRRGVNNSSSSSNHSNRSSRPAQVQVQATPSQIQTMHSRPLACPSIRARTTTTTLAEDRQQTTTSTRTRQAPTRADQPQEGPELEQTMPRKAWMGRAERRRNRPAGRGHACTAGGSRSASASLSLSLPCARPRGTDTCRFRLRSAQMRCTEAENGPPCKRCRQGGHEVSLFWGNLASVRSHRLKVKLISLCPAPDDTRSASLRRVSAASGATARPMRW